MSRKSESTTKCEWIVLCPHKLTWYSVNCYYSVHVELSYPCSLQRAKQNLAFKAEDTARLVVENSDMEKRIMELGQTHE